MKFLFFRSRENKFRTALRIILMARLRLGRKVFVGSLTFLLLSLAQAFRHSVLANSPSPTFYKDVLPLLQEHCQMCHRAGEIAPMPLITFRQVRDYAGKIKEMTSAKVMPPCFADPRYGYFSNDNTLKQEQIATIGSW